MDIKQQARPHYTNQHLQTLTNKSADADERAKAVIALAGIPSDSETLSRQQQIAECKDVAVFAAVEPYLHHEQVGIQRWAVRALRWMPAYQPDTSALPKLHPLLNTDNRDMRYDVIHLIGRCRHADAVTLLAPLIDERDDALTNRVLIALGNTEQPEAVDILLKHRRRGAAVRTLARMPDERAIRAVLDIARAKPHNDLWGALIGSARRLGMQDVVDECQRAADEINRHYPPR